MELQQFLLQLKIGFSPSLPQCHTEYLFVRTYVYPIGCLATSITQTIKSKGYYLAEDLLAGAAEDFDAGFDLEAGFEDFLSEDFEGPFLPPFILRIFSMRSLIPIFGPFLLFFESFFESFLAFASTTREPASIAL